MSDYAVFLLDVETRQVLQLILVALQIIFVFLLNDFVLLVDHLVMIAMSWKF